MGSVALRSWLEGEVVQHLLGRRFDCGIKLVYSLHPHAVLGWVTIAEPVFNNPTLGEVREMKGERNRRALMIDFLSVVVGRAVEWEHVGS